MAPATSPRASSRSTRRCSTSTSWAIAIVAVGGHPRGADSPSMSRNAARARPTTAIHRNGRLGRDSMVGLALPERRPTAEPYRGGTPAPGPKRTRVPSPPPWRASPCRSMSSWSCSFAAGSSTCWCKRPRRRSVAGGTCRRARSRPAKTSRPRRCERSRLRPGWTSRSPGWWRSSTCPGCRGGSSPGFASSSRGGWSRPAPRRAPRPPRTAWAPRSSCRAEIESLPLRAPDAVRLIARHAAGQPVAPIDSIYQIGLS